jgi:DNA-binding transcriptional regulator YiaG
MGNPASVALDANLLAAVQKVVPPSAQTQAAAAPAKQAAAPAGQPVEDKVTISAAAQAQVQAQAPAQAPAPAQVQAQPAAQPAAPPEVPTLTQIRNLSRQGESLVQIANKLGLSQQVVASYLGITVGQQ